MKIFNERRSEQFTITIFPYQLNGLEANISIGRFYCIDQSSSRIYLVEKKHIVNIKEKHAPVKWHTSLDFRLNICVLLYYIETRSSIIHTKVFYSL